MAASVMRTHFGQGRLTHSGSSIVGRSELSRAVLGFAMGCDVFFGEARDTAFGGGTDAVLHPGDEGDGLVRRGFRGERVAEWLTPIENPRESCVERMVESAVRFAPTPSTTERIFL